MISPAPPPIDPAMLKARLAHLAGPDWLTALRRDALDRFLQMGVPDTGHEDWKYTSLAHLAHQAWRVPDDPAHLSATTMNYPGVVLSFVNDQLVRQDAVYPMEILGTLAATTRAGLVEPAQLNGLVETRDALANLNTALWRDGTYLQVPAGERLTQPIFLRHTANMAKGMLCPRVLAVLAAGAEAIVVEQFLGDPDIPYWQNAVTDIQLHPGARLTHLRIVAEGNAATHTGLTAVHQAKDSAYHALNLTLDGRVVRHNLALNLAGAGANAKLDGMFIVTGRCHADQHLQVTHAAPHTTSATTYRGLADGRGHGIFDARATVQHGAINADVTQSSRNLLLSSNAEIDTKPQLEIYTDAVKCRHGATVGQLDADLLFYLQSRGIGMSTARRLLMEAFIDEALGLLSTVHLQDWFRPYLRKYLPGEAVNKERLL